ncbi:MAG: Unknown protein [uncultured Thiotrichaceae bacterium]|uniref:Uncharacterized protein n=1 Tax=uncultured Thiotrichaceae bacterium TaxID=298394 RepID=A0A6S6TQQ3_9GAMM|nr:MAG: Unknown protein [uncultured Thiotrichaceae bacterium]
MTESRHALISHLQDRVRDGQPPSALLNHMALDLDIKDQVELMKYFVEAFDLTLGEVTAIGAWWYEDEREMNDTDIDFYISPLLKGWLENNA